MTDELVNHFFTKTRLSSSFSPNLMHMVANRYHEIIKMQPGFMVLSDELRNKIWSKNFIVAVTLFVVKMESTATAMKQLQLFCGHLTDPDGFLAKFP